MKLNENAFSQLANIRNVNNMIVVVDKSNADFTKAVGIAVFEYRAEASKFWQKNQEISAGFFRCDRFTIFEKA